MYSEGGSQNGTFAQNQSAITECTELLLTSDCPFIAFVLFLYISKHVDQAGKRTANVEVTHTVYEHGVIILYNTNKH